MVTQQYVSFLLQYIPPVLAVTFVVVYSDSQQHGVLRYLCLFHPAGPGQVAEPGHLLSVWGCVHGGLELLRRIVHGTFPNQRQVYHSHHV